MTSVWAAVLKDKATGVERVHRFLHSPFATHESAKKELQSVFKFEKVLKVSDNPHAFDREGAEEN